MNRIATIVLAAGGSSRMGQAKQLLRIDGVTVVRRIVKTALASQCDRVYVVVGAEADDVSRELSRLEVTIVQNMHWSEGIGSSIRAGIQAVCKSRPPFAAVLLLLADQYAVDVALLNRIIAEFIGRSADIVACEYAGDVGAPALFCKSYFEDLQKLPVANGAKVLLHRHAAEVVRIPFPGGVNDIDTPEDLNRLQAPI